MEPESRFDTCSMSTNETRSNATKTLLKKDEEGGPPELSLGVCAPLLGESGAASTSQLLWWRHQVQPPTQPQGSLLASIHDDNNSNNNQQQPTHLDTSVTGPDEPLKRSKRCAKPVKYGEGQRVGIAAAANLALNQGVVAVRQLLVHLPNNTHGRTRGSKDAGRLCAAPQGPASRPPGPASAVAAR